MKPSAYVRHMPAQSQEHSRTASAKDASKARRNARRAKHSARSSS